MGLRSRAGYQGLNNPRSRRSAKVSIEVSIVILNNLRRWSRWRDSTGVTAPHPRVRTLR